jgi:hypothetical protein
MKNLVSIWTLIIILSGFVISSCDEPYEDQVPETFFMIQVNPDQIHMYNSGDSEGVRLDPLVNDSIKVEVSVTYSAPLHGIVKFVKNEGWFYVPQTDFFGVDNIIYSVCTNGDCYSASITMVVEQPLDLNTCGFEIANESVEINHDEYIEIRIFDNDTVCPYMGSSIFAPEKGTFTTYTYSGTFRNTVYVYYPPKGYVGSDTFKYRLFTDNGFIEAHCNITIK